MLWFFVVCCPKRRAVAMYWGNVLYDVGRVGGDCIEALCHKMW